MSTFIYKLLKLILIIKIYYIIINHRMDCLYKVIRTEGITGCYRGILYNSSINKNYV